MNKSLSLCLAGVFLLVSCGDKKPEPAAQTTLEQAKPQARPEPPVEPSATTISPSGSADRLPPPEVPPVERDGVRYAQAEDGRKLGLDQVGGVLVASDLVSGKRLWTLAVYANPVDKKLEADVQWLYFSSMAFDPDGRLRIVNEAGKAFLVDVKTHKVTPAP